MESHTTHPQLVPFSQVCEVCPSCVEFWFCVILLYSITWLLLYEYTVIFLFHSSVGGIWVVPA